MDIFGKSALKALLSSLFWVGAYIYIMNWLQAVQADLIIRVCMISNRQSTLQHCTQMGTFFKSATFISFFNYIMNWLQAVQADLIIRVCMISNRQSTLQHCTQMYHYINQGPAHLIDGHIKAFKALLPLPAFLCVGQV
jgi:hypothetical protein